LATSVTCTTTNRTFTGAFFIWIFKCGDEVTLTFDAEEVAVLAQSVACVVTANTVDAESALALIRAFAVHTIGLKCLALTLGVTERTTVTVFIGEAIFRTIRLDLVRCTTTGHRA